MTIDDDTYLVEDDSVVTKPKRKPKAKVEPTAVPKLAPANSTEEMTRIIIEKNDTIPPSGLSIGLNGRQWAVRPGKPVDVPPGILEVLDNAIYSAPVVDPDTLKVIDYEDRLRYPYRVLKGTSKQAA